MKSPWQVIKIFILAIATLLAALFGYLNFTLGCSIAGHCTASEERKALLAAALALVVGGGIIILNVVHDRRKNSGAAQTNDMASKSLRFITLSIIALFLIVFVAWSVGA